MVQPLEELQNEAQIIRSKPPLKMTYEEFLNWAIQEETYAEWVNGEAIFLPSVTSEHQELGSFLLTTIYLFVEKYHKGKVFYSVFQMKTAPQGNSRLADLFFVANKNLSHLKKYYFDGGADLVVEITTPESRARDRGDKFYEYEEGGVSEYWLLDPVRKQAEFYHRDENGIYQLLPVDENGIFHSREIEGLWLKVEWLWQSPLPTVFDVMKAWGLM